MMRKAMALGAVVATAAFGGCSLLDWRGLERGMVASEAGDEGAAEGGAEASAYAGDAGLDGAAMACPGDSGPPMILLPGNVCIDSTEVTIADYEQFLGATAGDTIAQPDMCVWNTSYVPHADWPPVPGTESWPVHAVSWCDAYMYCAWAGKRLCGRPGGGTYAPADDQSGEWYWACSSAGVNAWVYGNTYDPTACNGAGSGLGHFADAGSFPRCRGGFDAGVSDLCGNATEWEDSCFPADGGADASCIIHSGNYADDQGGIRCDRTFTDLRSGTDYYTGIRCCATAR